MRCICRLTVESSVAKFELAIPVLALQTKAVRISCVQYGKVGGRDSRRAKVKKMSSGSAGTDLCIKVKHGMRLSLILH